MLVARIKQQSVESRRYDISYANRLRTSELLATVGAVVIAPTTVPPMAATPYKSADNTTVNLYVEGGVDGTTYTLQVQVTTTDSGGVLWEDELEVSVEDI